MQTTVMVDGKAMQLDHADKADLAAKMKQVRDSGYNIELVQSDRAGALTHGAMQGLSLGYGDEIYARLKSLNPFDDDERSYRQVRDEYRNELDALRQSNPGAFTAGEVAGGLGSMLVPGAALARGAKGASTAAKLGKLVGAGAAEGAIAGTGYSEADDLANLGVDAAGGAVLGAGASALGATVLPTLGRGGAATWRALTRTDEQKADDLLRAALQGGGRGSDEVVEAITNNGQPGQLMDIDDNLMQLASVAKSRSTDGQSVIDSALIARQDAAPDRVRTILEDAANIRGGTGRRGEAAEAIEGLTPRVNRLYSENVDNMGIVKTDELEAIIDSPLVKPYTKTTAKNYESLYPEMGNPFAGDVIPMRAIDDLKRQMDAGINSFGRPGATPSHQQGSRRATTAMRDRLINAVQKPETGNPGYKATRDRAATQIGMRNALDAGYSGARIGNLDQVNAAEEALSAMRPREQVMFRQGLLSQMADRDIGGGRGNQTGDIARKFYNTGDPSEIATRRLGLLSSSDEAAEEAARRLANERRYNEVQRTLRTTTGSRTAPLLQAAEQADESLGALQAGAEAVSGGLSGLVDRAGRAITGANRVNERTGEMLAQALANKTQDEQVAIVRRLMDEDVLPADFGEYLAESIASGNVAGVMQALSRPAYSGWAQDD